VGAGSSTDSECGRGGGRRHHLEVVCGQFEGCWRGEGRDNQTVEKSRDYWREKAEDLEKRSPEVVERTLAERIQIRDGEINRLKEDKEFDKITLRTLEVDKAELEQDLFRTQGFRAMLALEDGLDDEPRDDVEPALSAGGRV
jgi:hypothetical protein